MGFKKKIESSWDDSIYKKSHKNEECPDTLQRLGYYEKIYLKFVLFDK